MSDSYGFRFKNSVLEACLTSAGFGPGNDLDGGLADRLQACLQQRLERADSLFHKTHFYKQYGVKKEEDKLPSITTLFAEDDE